MKFRCPPAAAAPSSVVSPFPAASSPAVQQNYHPMAAALYQNHGQDPPASSVSEDRQRSAEPINGLRPHRTAPGLRGVGSRALVYKSLPDLQQQQLASPAHNREDSLIDLSPANENTAQQRLYANTADADSGSAPPNLQASASSLLDLPVEDQQSSVWKSQNYSNDFLAGERAGNFASSTFIASSEYSHDSSFNSLPDGATYHEPPDDEEEEHEEEEHEEQDPFDTSSVMVNRSVGSTEAQITSGGQPTGDTGTGSNLTNNLSGSTSAPHQLSDSESSFENRRSIISQLLASQATPNPFALPPMDKAVNSGGQFGPTGSPAQQAGGNTNGGPRYRTVSSVSEPDAFSLLPLTSPFSPPAFNPYDVVLGPNETIAGKNNSIR